MFSASLSLSLKKKLGLAKLGLGQTWHTTLAKLGFGQIWSRPRRWRFFL